MLKDELMMKCLQSLGVDAALAARVADPLAQACRENDVNTPKRVACLLGQLMVESSRFEHTEENLSYRTTKALASAFGSRMAARMDLFNAPEKLANVAYANRLGNGDEASGDGWKYRGSGWIQTTGRANFNVVKMKTGVDVIAVPDKLRYDYEVMAKAAVIHFVGTNCLTFADAGLIDSITRAVNGPKMLQAEARAMWTKKALEYLTSNWDA